MGYLLGGAGADSVLCYTLLFFSTLCDCVALVIVPRNLSLEKFGKFVLPFGGGAFFVLPGALPYRFFCSSLFIEKAI